MAEEGESKILETLLAQDPNDAKALLAIVAKAIEDKEHQTEQKRLEDREREEEAKRKREEEVTKEELLALDAFNALTPTEFVTKAQLTAFVKSVVNETLSNKTLTHSDTTEVVRKSLNWEQKGDRNLWKASHSKERKVWYEQHKEGHTSVTDEIKKLVGEDNYTGSHQQLSSYFFTCVKNFDNDATEEELLKLRTKAKGVR